MDTRNLNSRSVGCAFALALMLAAPAALAQTTAPAQAPAAKPATPAQSRPAAPAAQKPAAPAQAQPAQPAQAPAADQNAQQQAQMPQLMYSPWVKICQKASAETNNKPVCVTAKDGRVEDGRPVVAAALIEPEGDQKFIRITVPLGMQLPYGTRMTLDQEQPLSGPYFLCVPNGCMADYPASAELIGKLKKGKTLLIQAVNLAAVPISLPLPLNDFAKAYDGPPTDPKVLEEQQRKLQEELQKKAEEARKQIENAPSAAATPPAAPATAPKR